MSISGMNFLGHMKNSKRISFKDDLITPKSRAR